ncbi:MAG: hypothetical protein P8017_09580 [Deltaproteobacteria bacterium]|jgi:hypothetical protein
MSKNPADNTIAALAARSWEFAKVWDYSISHSILRIRLNESTAGLALHDCEHVTFDPVWAINNLKIVSYDHPHGRRYRVTDGDHLDVDCGQVYFSEHMQSGF